jgi:hypothetical protein
MATQQRPGSGSRLAVTSTSRCCSASRWNGQFLSRITPLLIGALALGRLAAVYDRPLRRSAARAAQ